MENNEIMQRLLEDDKQKSTLKDELSSSKANRDAEIQMSRIRVVTAKYKVYIVLLAIFICLLLLVYIPKINDTLKSRESTYNSVNAQLDNIEREIRIAQDDMVYLCDNSDGIIKNEENLGKCLNERAGCTSLPKTWSTGTGEETHYDLSIPLSYLQLHSLYNKKMPVDEKRVLKNLNEYLVKQDISGSDKRKVGDILKINIGDPEPVVKGDEHFFQVTVDVEIKFDTIGDLTGFLQNVEKKLIKNSEDRILYKIQTVSYDIVTNDEPQITDISMMAYYYHDERFDDKVECEESNGSGENRQLNQNIDESEDSDSMFDKIFKKLKI